MSEGERLIAFEAAIEELSELRLVGARYRSLEKDAESLIGELNDLGRTLRQARRRAAFTDDVVDDAVGRIRRLRQNWHRRLAALRESDLYQETLEAYARGDAEQLGAALPELFSELERVQAPSFPLYQPLVLTTHRRAAGSPFRAPAAIADDVEQLRREGLRAHAHGKDWWDTDLAALTFAPDLAAIESPAALLVERFAASVAVFRERESLLVFAPQLQAEIAVALAETSDDAWYEAVAGSYEEYRDALARELRQRAVAVHLHPAW